MKKYHPPCPQIQNGDKDTQINDNEIISGLETLCILLTDIHPEAIRFCGRD